MKRTQKWMLILFFVFLEGAAIATMASSGKLRSGEAGIVSSALLLSVSFVLDSLIDQQKRFNAGTVAAALMLNLVLFFMLAERATLLSIFLFVNWWLCAVIGIRGVIFRKSGHKDKQERIRELETATRNDCPLD